MIVCMAVVGKGQEPLFFRCFTDAGDGEDASFRLQQIVHSSLDMVSELKAANRRATPPDMFLGHLCPVEEHCVYGYLTTTGIKILAVLEDNASIREGDLQGVMTAVHDIYVSYLRNPFAPLKGPITSERFQRAVDRQVHAYNAD